MREMKDTSVFWCPTIPTDWSTIKNKYILSLLYSGGTPSAGDEKFYTLDNGVPFVSISDMSSVAYVKSTKKQVTDLGIADKRLIVLPKGTILYSIYATVGAVSELEIEATISQAMLALQVNDSIYKPFYKYNLLVMREYVLSDTNGNTQFNLNAEKVRNFVFILPPLEDQQKIAAHLDRKCTQIDALISNAQQQIEKLKAYKQSVVTETVTKGLDPDVEMKDSGVEWIGEIPEHWELTRIKNKFQLRNEKNDEPDLSKVNLISLYTDLGVVQHSDLEETTGNKAVTAEGYKKVYEGDIVVNIILCWMGAVGKSAFNGVTSPAYDIYKPLQNTHSDYYHYLFRTKRFNGECYRYGRGIMMMRWRTYSTEFSSIFIPEPPIEEQQAIADYLDRKCSQIDKLIALKQQKIEKLQQYKKSLIYEYVTGKKEVTA